MDLRSIEEMLDFVPASLNSTEIAHAVAQLEPPYSVDHWLLPLPPWALRPYTESGNEAWELLKQDASANPRITQPMCIYIHIPFCATKCGFCDSYSFRLASHRPQHTNAYVAMLKNEIEIWRQQGALAVRPVSTVHFGGGTPTFLNEQELEELVNTIKFSFHVTDKTEWALESTATGLTSSMFDCLQALGFRRLHVGVQTLEDRVRATIGRRTDAHTVLKKIEFALQLGWVVSVDLICGLPGEALASFLHGIETLADLGVDGFSLYELLVYAQNQKWANQHQLPGRSHLPNFIAFLAGSQILETRGYRKNLFNHWANERDDNCYFTFPTRGEDLLALGTIADGVFGDYHYRHPRYHQYDIPAGSAFPGLAGGLRRTTWENHVWRIVTALLAGKIPDAFPSVLPDDIGRRLITRWQQNGLLRTTSCGDELSGSGSWFVGNMLREFTNVPHNYAVSPRR